MFWSSQRPKVLRGLNFFESEPQQNWGLSMFCSSQSPNVLGGLNLFEF